MIRLVFKAVNVGKASPGCHGRFLRCLAVCEAQVSHSWSDSPERKWRALQLVADSFYRLRLGFQPTKQLGPGFPVSFVRGGVALGAILCFFHAGRGRNEEARLKKKDDS